MNRNPIFLSVLVLLVLCSSSLDAFVHAAGDSIVDGQGNIVLRRGMGLGGWLVPEGYMLQTPGFGSPSSIRADIVALVGEAVADSFYQRYHDAYVTREDILQLGEWGFDHIRMPFHHDMFSPARGVWRDWGFEVTDSLLAWCEAADMLLVLDMHCAPGGQNGGNISDSDGTARLWLADSNKAHTIDIWYTIAQRYADEPRIAGYDLLNEPVLPDGIPATDLRALYMDLTTAVRQVDANHLLFIEGNWYATDFTSLTPPWDTNLAYSFHKYWSLNTQGSIQSFLNIRNAFHVPLWMSESGENSNTWFHDAVQLFEENDIGWCWWTHKKVETVTSPYSAVMPSQFQTLIDYWNDSADQPSALYAQAALFALTENLKTENCVYRPGVIPALFDAAYGEEHHPVKDHELPAEVLTADYDIGRQDIAYHDADYQNSDWANYTPWNRGYRYRNDGVDIEMNDPIPSVGWTEDGEWMKYTLHSALDAIYDLTIEVAGPGNGGLIRLYLDGELRASIASLPNTGGWYIWEEVAVDDLVIPAGDHILKLEIAQAGFNLRRMRFDIDSLQTEQQFPNAFNLGQNYPNPFNGTTRIPIVLQWNTGAILEISNICGESVYVESLGGYAGTSFEVSWEGISDSGNPLPGGIYLYRVQSGEHSQVRKMLLLK